MTKLLIRTKVLIFASELTQSVTVNEPKRSKI